jgi:hypothetical protein
MTITGDVRKDRMLFDDLNKMLDDRNYASKKVDGVKKTLQAFLWAPKVRQREIIKAFSVSSDFERLTEAAFNVTIEEDNFDLGWQKAFRNVPLAKGSLGWEIYTVTNGIAFQKVEEGGRIEQNGMAGTKVRAECDYYGGAMGFTDRMIRDRQIPAMLDAAMMFRNKFWANKGDNHYALISAAAVNQTTYQGVAADGQLRRDVQTLNRACYDLANRNKDKGYGNTAAATYVMYAHLLDRERIEAAKNVVTNSLNAVASIGETVGYKIEVVYTLNQYITQGSPILCLPGQKAQSAEALAPTTYSPGGADPLTLNQYQAVWSIYGAVIADTDQFQEVELG